MPLQFHTQLFDKMAYIVLKCSKSLYRFKANLRVKCVKLMAIIKAERIGQFYKIERP